MVTIRNPDELVAFPDVRVIGSTVADLLCRIRGRCVWLPRRHISGKLWQIGDRGKLFIRQWVALDRNLIDLHGTRVLALSPATSPARLHLVRSKAARAD
jgi:hypothetical protein